MHGRMVSAHDWVMRSPPLLPACQFERYEAELLAFHSSLGDVKTYVALRTPMIKDEDNSGTMRRLWGGGDGGLPRGGVSHPSPMPLERTEGHTPPLPRARRGTRARVDHRADQQGPRGQARQGRRHGLRWRRCAPPPPPPKDSPPPSLTSLYVVICPRPPSPPLPSHSPEQAGVPLEPEQGGEVHRGLQGARDPEGGRGLQAASQGTPPPPHPHRHRDSAKGGGQEGQKQMQFYNFYGDHKNHLQPCIPRRCGFSFQSARLRHDLCAMHWILFLFLCRSE